MYTPKIFITLVLNSIYLILQTDILTPFREPMPATSHFDILGFKPKIFENNLKVFICSLIYFWSFNRKQKCSFLSLFPENVIENWLAFPKKWWHFNQVDPIFDSGEYRIHPKIGINWFLLFLDYPVLPRFHRLALICILQDV